MDCLEGMRMLPDKCVDLVVTDCPYHICGGGCSNGAYGDGNGIFQKTNEPSGMMSHRVKKSGGTTNGVSKHIDLYGVLGGGGVRKSQVDNARSGKLFEHNDIQFSEWLPEVYRVLKDGTHCYIMINGRNLCELQTEAEKVGFQYQQLLAWKKNNSTPNRYYLQCLEFILMLRKGAARNINDMGVSNCLSVPNIIGKEEGKFHPTAKPVKLMELLISESCNEGDIVLDPFAGGGSTLIAARNLKRNYIGYEIDELYYRLCLKGLAQEQQATLF